MTDFIDKQQPQNEYIWEQTLFLRKLSFKILLLAIQMNKLGWYLDNVLKFNQEHSFDVYFWETVSKMIVFTEFQKKIKILHIYHAVIKD